MRVRAGGTSGGARDRRAVSEIFHRRGAATGAPAAPTFTDVFDDRAIDNTTFQAYVERHLVPTLRRGDGVVLDGLDGPRAIECSGHRFAANTFSYGSVVRTSLCA
ncbi:MAG: hypothetical protein AB7N65_25145 [Vicinamibacterales bacterium]